MTEKNRRQYGKAHKNSALLNHADKSEAFYSSMIYRR
jgi:hypothetical protein